MPITLDQLGMKVDSVAEDIAEIKTQLSEMNGRQRTDHDSVTQLREGHEQLERRQSRVERWMLGQFGFSGLASCLAWIFGGRSPTQGP